MRVLLAALLFALLAALASAGADEPRLIPGNPLIGLSATPEESARMGAPLIAGSAVAPGCSQFGGYPWVQNGCLNASDLNAGIDMSQGALPPQNSFGQGARQFHWWVDTSTSPSTLRQCANPAGCSTTYTPSDWFVWGTLNPSTQQVELTVPSGLKTVVLASGSSGSVQSSQSLYITSTFGAAKSIVAPTCGPTNDTNMFSVVDWVGTAATYNVTVTPPAGTTINSLSSVTFKTNKQAVTWKCFGSAADWRPLEWGEPISNTQIPAYAQYAPIVGTGAAGFGTVAPGSNGQLLVGQTNANPAFETVSGDGAMSAGGALSIVSLRGGDVAVPNVTDTVAMLAATQALLNKTINCSLNTCSNLPTSALTGANGIGDALLAQAGAATLKGVPGASTANVSDFTVQGLTDISTPSPTLDWLLIWNHTTGTFEKANPTELLTAVSTGVTSLSVGPGLGANASVGAVTVTPLGDPGSITNCTTAWTVSAGALTATLKTQAGATPSSSSPCVVSFGNGAGGYAYVPVTAATSFSTGVSGSSFGSLSGQPFRLWAVAIDNGGTVALGLFNATSLFESASVFTSIGVMALNEGATYSTTACAACTNATAAQTIYSTSALSSKNVRLLGYAEWGGGLTLAGTYASVPTLAAMMGPGVKRPGDVVQTKLVTSTTPLATSNGSYQTGPSGSITPTSAANLVNITASSGVALTAGLNSGYVGLFRGTVSGTKLFAENKANAGDGGVYVSDTIGTLDAPGAAASQTYTIGVAGDGTNVITYCLTGQGGMYCTMKFDEIMGSLDAPGNPA